MTDQTDGRTTVDIQDAAREALDALAESNRLLSALVDRPDSGPGGINRLGWLVLRDLLIVFAASTAGSGHPREELMAHQLSMALLATMAALAARVDPDPDGPDTREAHWRDATGKIVRARRMLEDMNGSRR